MNNRPNGYSHQLPPNERWLTIKEVIEMFKISASTLARLRKKKLLPYSTPTRRVLINMQDVLDFIDKNRQG